MPRLELGPTLVCRCAVQWLCLILTHNVAPAEQSIQDLRDYWLNLDSVQEALHVHNPVMPWAACCAEPGQSGLIFTKCSPPNSELICGCGSRRGVCAQLHQQLDRHAPNLSVLLRECATAPHSDLLRRHRHRNMPPRLRPTLPERAGATLGATVAGLEPARVPGPNCRICRGL